MISSSTFIPSIWGLNLGCQIHSVLDLDGWRERIVIWIHTALKSDMFQCILVAPVDFVRNKRNLLSTFPLFFFFLSFNFHFPKCHYRILHCIKYLKVKEVIKPLYPKATRHLPPPSFPESQTDKLIPTFNFLHVFFLHSSCSEHLFFSSSSFARLSSYINNDAINS